MKKIINIFLLAFILNIFWENLHSFLYSNYMGGKITEFILLRASLFDALLITVILLPFIFLNSLKNNKWLIIVFGIIIAILNEWYGLSAGRWDYNSLMPILPIIKTGLTPTFQLGVLGYISYILEERISKKLFL
mgnify:FL=1